MKPTRLQMLLGIVMIWLQAWAIMVGLWMFAYVVKTINETNTKVAK